MVTSAEVKNMERRFNERMDSIEKLTRQNSLAIGANTANIDRLTVNLDRLTKSTQGIVDVWSAGRTLQKAVKWLSGFAFIGTLIAWFTGKLG